MKTEDAFPVVAKSRFKWAVAVFSARETSTTLLQTVEAAMMASDGDTVIDVLVNGNDTLATEISSLIQAALKIGSHLTIRVWSISLGDKAHAWNEYVHRVWPGSDVVFFIDGYVRVRPNAFSLLAQGLADTPLSFGATGVPSVGSNTPELRESLLAVGGLHGNLFALKASTMSQLRSQKSRLPLGIYRTDSTLGAALAFGLDPANNKWDYKRILVLSEVTWETDERRWWRYSEIKSQVKRVLRQAQGTLENAAVRDFMARRRTPLNKLPRTIVEVIADWIDKNPVESHKLLRRSPMRIWAWKRLCAARDWSNADVDPKLMFVSKEESA
jgi:hypothetical protein